MNEKEKALNIFKNCSLNRYYFDKYFMRNVTYKNPVFISTENPEKLNLAISEFISLKKYLCFSSDFIIETLLRVLIICKDKEESDFESRADLFIQILNEIEYQDYQITKTLNGVDISYAEEPLKLVDSITIYDLPKHIEHLKPLCTFNGSSEYEYYKDRKMVVIESIVRAKDEGKALEIANGLFNKFELLLAFILNEQHKKYAVGILRVNTNLYQHSLTNSKNSMFFNTKENNSSNVATLNLSELDNYLPYQYINYDSLLKITISPESTLDKKISSAIEWLGESYIDINKSSSYLKAVIALEALLKSDEKGVITPSIMSVIAERCAFLHGNDVQECIETERRVKKIYAERSKIAHTGTSSVSSLSLQLVRGFVRDSILYLIFLKNTKNLESLEDFESILREKKYQDGGFKN